MNFFNELKNRWKQESPEFYDKIKYWSDRATATSILIFTAGKVIPGSEVAMPEWLVVIAGHLALAGFVLSFFARTPVKNPDYKTLGKADPTDDSIGHVAYSDGNGGVIKPKTEL